MGGLLEFIGNRMLTYQEFYRFDKLVCEKDEVSK